MSWVELSVTVLVSMLTVIILWFYFRDTANYLLDYTKCGKRRRKRKMAEEDVQKCMQWLFQKQGEMENTDFGSCQADVLEALKQQKSRNEEISLYGENIAKLIVKHQLQARDSRDLKDTYDSVKAVSSKRSSCMQILSGIATLEDPIENLATEFDARAVHLVNLSENNKVTPAGNHQQSNESMAKASQNCVVAVRNNWRWISTVLQCAQVHLHNAAAYQEFFHEVEEVEYWMTVTMSRIHLSFDRSKLKGDKADANLIHDEIKDVMLAYLQWQGKVESLFERAKSVVPVPNRLTKLGDERPVVALTDFRSNEIEFREGETLTLLDNSDRTRWMVKNAREQTSMVPAVVLLMPAPSAGAVDAAIKLRVQLLSLWTMSIKRLGYQMITFMLFVFRDWTEEERKGLRDMDPAEKEHLLRSMNQIETTLEKSWDGYEDFSKLQARMVHLKNVLNEAADKKGTSKNMTAVVQIRSLENLLNKYKDFWAYWETFKVIVELVREPKHLLVCDKWDELKYITTAHFVKFWDVSVDMKNGEMSQTPNGSTNTQTSQMTNGYVTDSKLGPGSTVTSDSTVSMHDGEGVGTTNVSAITFFETPRKPFPERSQEDRIDYKLNEIEVEESMTKTDMVVEESMISKNAPRTKGAFKDLKANGEDESWKSTSEEWGIITETTTTRTKTGTEEQDEVDESMVQETIQKEESEKVQGAPEKWEHDTEDIDYETRTTTTKKYGTSAQEEEAVEEEVWETVEETFTEDVQSSTVVEAQTLELTEAKDTRTGEFFELNEAAKMGIIDFTAKEFVDMQTMKRIPFSAAINEGFVKFELRSKKTIKRESKNYGLMTIRSTKDNRPFSIHTVIDPASEEELTVAEAVDKGILNKSKNKYITEDGDSMTILDAIHSGLIKADFKEIDGSQESTEIVEKTYAVYGVVNQKTKSTVSFSEAISLRILDCKEGMYIQNVDKVKIPISDAIMKGFIKARFVTDPSKLDGDPSQNIVVERLANTKSKILRAVRAARAFKMATN